MGGLNIALVKRRSYPWGLTVSQPTGYILLAREIGFLGQYRILIETLPVTPSC